MSRDWEKEGRDEEVEERPQREREGEGCKAPGLPLISGMENTDGTSGEEEEEEELQPIRRQQALLPVRQVTNSQPERILGDSARLLSYPSRTTISPQNQSSTTTRVRVHSHAGPASWLL